MILSSLDARLSGSSRSEALESSDSARCNFCPTRPESRAARVLVIVAGMLDDERACSHKALAKCPTRARALCTLLKQQIWVGRANHKCRSCWRQSPCVLCPASSTQLVLSFLLHCERIMYTLLVSFARSLCRTRSVRSPGSTVGKITVVLLFFCLP